MSVARSAAALAAVIALATPLSAGHAQSERTGALLRDSYVLEGKRDYSGAIVRVREARNAGATAYFVALRSGWLSYLLADYQGAIASYSEAVAAEPKAIEPKLGLTLPLLAQRNWRELERACMAVLQLDPRNATALSRLGLAQYNAGNFAGAEATYRRLVDDYPADLDYRTGLGWAQLKLGRNADARTTFEWVLAVSPDNVNARAGLSSR
jgi:tetratricopeptide (TPR) repeat protein